jgi:hypothetical protein
MRTRHTHRITRRTAEQLLSGSARSGPEQLIDVLNAATAPAREGELAGEQAAMAALAECEATLPFVANHLGPAATPGERKMFRLPLAKVLTVKALAWSLVGLVTAGAAAAAGTVALSSLGSASRDTGVSSGSAAAPRVHPALAGNAAQGAARGIARGVLPAAAGSARPASLPHSQPLSPVQLCTDLTSKVEAAIGDTEGDDTESEQALASPSLATVLSSPAFEPLITKVDDAAAVPDYCGLLLSLPRVPVPGALTQVPASVLDSTLASLPADRLAQVFGSLPAGTLSRVLGGLPSAELGNALTSLPAADVTMILTTLPDPAAGMILTALPTSALGTVLTELPASSLDQVLTGLPTSTLGSLLVALPSSTATEILSKLPSTVLSGLQGALPSSILSQLPLNLTTSWGGASPP